MAQALKAAAWVLLIAIFAVTDGPLGLRPTFGHPNAERLLALIVIGLAFSFAYPRRIPVVLVLLAGAVCGFEYLQQFVSYRHGTPHDALVKLVGAFMGVGVGIFVSKFTDSSQATK